MLQKKIPLRHCHEVSQDWKGTAARNVHEVVVEIDKQYIKNLGHCEK